MDCVICCTALREGAQTHRLPCGHGDWHEECVRLWLVECATCPICRAPVPDPEGEDAETAELCDLRATRSELTQRMAELEDERRDLEQQVQHMETELLGFRTQLCMLRRERTSLVGRMAMRSGSANSDASWEAAAGFAGGSRRQDRGSADRIAAAVPEAVPEATLAWELLCRLREAVLRTPMPAAQVFQLLACRSGGRLDREHIGEVLLRLEASASGSALELAFHMLDANHSGFVEEADWLAGLRLPRMTPRWRGIDGDISCAASQAGQAD